VVPVHEYLISIRERKKEKLRKERIFLNLLDGAECRRLTLLPLLHKVGYISKGK
jgi:hypothetical protein